MRVVVFLLLASLSLGSGIAIGQSVYKCVDDRGTTVFSQRPCADDPAKVETVDTSRSLKTGTGGAVAQQSEFAQLNEIRRRCDTRLRAVEARYGGQYGRIAREIASLEARSATATNNLAGATLESALRSQIAGLMAERGTLKAAEAQELTAAREQCRLDEQAEQERQMEAQNARAEAQDAADNSAKDKAAADKAKIETDATQR